MIEIRTADLAAGDLVDRAAVIQEVEAALVSETEGPRGPERTDER